MKTRQNNIGISISLIYRSLLHVHVCLLKKLFDIVYLLSNT